MLMIEATGHLTKDAEVLTSSKTGDKFVKFDIAVNKGKDKVEYVEVVFGAEKLAPYLLKGTLVWVMGEPRPKGYVNKEGNVITKLQIYKTTKLELLAKPRGNSTVTTPQTQQGQGIMPQYKPEEDEDAFVPPRNSFPNKNDDEDDDDIPF